MMKHKHSILRGPALLLAAALCLWATLGLYRALAWPRDQIRLENIQGEVTALEGFTVSGALLADWGSGLEYCLADGSLTTRPAVLQERMEDIHGYWGWTCTTKAVVASQAWETCAGAATSSPISKSAGAYFLSKTTRGESFTSQASQFVQTLTLELPTGSLHLALQEIKTAAPREVRAYFYDDGEASDFELLPIGYESMKDLTGYSMEIVRVVDFAGTTYFALEDAGEASGLWRVDELLTPEQIAALPKTAQMGKHTLAPESQPYGSATLVYPAPAGERILDLQTTQDSLCLLLQHQTEPAYLLVFDENLRQTDRLAPATPDAGGRYLGAGLRSDEIKIISYLQNGQQDTNGQDVLLRLQAGQITARAELTNQSADYQGGSLVFSRDATRLLCIEQQIRTMTDGNARYEFDDGSLLTVYPVTAQGTVGQPLYCGKLNCGQDLFGQYTPRDKVNPNLVINIGGYYHYPDYNAGLYHIWDDETQRQSRWPEAAQ